MASKCSLPSVVLCIEKEVGTDDGNTDSNNAQDHQNQHHKSIHIVNLVGPERCEDEVPLGRCEVVFNLVDIHSSYGFNLNPETNVQTYISMNIDPNGRMPPRHTITAGSMNLPIIETFSNKTDLFTTIYNRSA